LKDPQPHITVAWTLGNILPLIGDKAEGSLEDSGNHFFGINALIFVDDLSVGLKSIVCKSGKWSFNVT
jgi:hypothetical protein